MSRPRPLCRGREREDEYFADCVLFAHDTLAAHGKRMWMWDDFLAFHPKALARIPRDVVMMHWCYDDDISDWGCRLNFAGRLREDADVEVSAAVRLLEDADDDSAATFGHPGFSWTPSATTRSATPYRPSPLASAGRGNV